ncbi:MAG: hypothetical protein R3B06_04095 [Kofleriaceae bacterium]
MSWDVLLMRLPADVASLEELPEGFVPPPLGAPAEVRAALAAAVPELDFADPSWGRITGDDFSIEVSVDADEPVGTVMLHVRGGDGALPVVGAMVAALGVSAIDCGPGTLLLLDSPAAAASFAAWRDYRDDVVDDA